jgi:hypothetical protein
MGHRLTVDVPVLRPDLGGNFREEPGPVHPVPDLGADDLGERLDGEKEPGAGGMPGPVLRRKRRAR